MLSFAGKKESEDIIMMMKNAKMYGYQILAGVLALVATAAASFCCCYQPEVPQNLKKFSKN